MVIDKALFDPSGDDINLEYDLLASHLVGSDVSKMPKRFTVKFTTKNVNVHFVKYDAEEKRWVYESGPVASQHSYGEDTVTVYVYERFTWDEQ